MMHNQPHADKLLQHRARSDVLGFVGGPSRAPTTREAAPVVRAENQLVRSSSREAGKGCWRLMA